jgi:hypothetical protein
MYARLVCTVHAVVRPCMGCLATCSVDFDRGSRVEEWRTRAESSGALALQRTGGSRRRSGGVTVGGAELEGERACERVVSCVPMRVYRVRVPCGFCVPLPIPHLHAAGDDQKDLRFHLLCSLIFS